jgi:DNA polymerase zeta
LFEIKAERDSANGLPPNGQPVDEDETSEFSSDEESNPFEALAMAQASQEAESNVEVNHHAISPNTGEVEEEDEEETLLQRHAKDARQHAENSLKLRATQGPARGNEREDYDDEELDELFRNTSFGGSGNPAGTPRLKRANGSTSVTPTTAGASGGFLEGRSAMREQRLREQAGLGDLRYDFDTQQETSLIASAPSSIDRQYP